MTSHDEDKAIDFRKLEKELDNAVQADAKYWRENDAKFRALHQKVATYDEFRDIVKASHLKPLEKDDRLTNIKFTQPWNTQATKKNPSDELQKDGKELSSDKTLPTTGQAFIREWRKLKNDSNKQYDYLLELGGVVLGQIFKNEIGFGLLGDFGRCINCCFAEKDVQSVINILHHLAQTNRFNLTVQFLSSKEKSDLTEVFAKLKLALDCSSSAETKGVYTDEDFEELCKQFDIKK